jgi:phosphoglycolate phosphatase-like HAD superfamily hydrolase
VGNIVERFDRASQHEPGVLTLQRMGPIVCVDLNGVLDAYTGWRGSEHFDPPRPGAREFLEALARRGYTVVVFTTRYPDDVWRWLKEFNLDALVQQVTDRKPAAHVFVDDRAVCFRGDFDSTLREIDVFSAHWENGVS